MVFPAMHIGTGNPNNSFIGGVQAGQQNQLFRQKYAGIEEDRAQEKRMVETRRGAIGGDEEMALEWQAQNPEEYADFKESASKMDKEQREAAKDRLDVIGRLYAHMDGMNPLQQASEWPKMRRGLERAGMDTQFIPEQYSPDLGQMAQLQTMSEKYFLDREPAPSGYRKVDDRLEAIPGGPAEKQQYQGDPQFDSNIGKYYQTNPETGKREYISPQTGMEITTADGTTIRTGVRGTDPAERVRAKTEAALKESKATGLKALRGIARIKQQLGTDGATIQSLAGAFARLANSGTAQVKALAKQVGIDLTPGRFEFSAFPQTAGKSAGFRSNVLDLAFLTARSSEPGGRLSDRDVQMALDRLGAKSGSPEQMYGALNETIDRIIDNIDIDFQTQLKESSGMREAARALGIDIGTGAPGTVEDLRNLSDEEVLRLMGLP